jgi:hypothetical protein
MLKLDWYDDGIVYIHDCDSCEIWCFDIGLYLLNVEKWKYEN